jgi:hypothetical protein
MKGFYLSLFNVVRKLFPHTFCFINDEAPQRGQLLTASKTGNICVCQLDHSLFHFTLNETVHAFIMVYAYSAGHWRDSNWGERGERSTNKLPCGHDRENIEYKGNTDDGLQTLVS